MWLTLSCGQFLMSDLALVDAGMPAVTLAFESRRSKMLELVFTKEEALL